MYQYSNQLLGIEDPNTIVYRIFSRKRFIELISSNSNCLRRPSLWDDPFENLYLNAKVTTDDGKPVSILRLRDSFYGQCWTSRPESDALWRIYSTHCSKKPDQVGVRVSVRASTLLESTICKRDQFASLRSFLGRVEYEPRDSIESSFATTSLSSALLGGTNQWLVRALLMKRSEFDHEEEIRLLHVDTNGTHKNSDTMKFSLPSAKLEQTVLLDPRLKDDDFAKHCSELKLSGWNGSIEKSNLYSAPILDIKL